jgi:hypothetical protein
LRRTNNRAQRGHVKPIIRRRIGAAGRKIADRLATAEGGQAPRRDGPEFRSFVQRFILVPTQILRTGRQLIYRLLAWRPDFPIFFRLLDGGGRPSNGARGIGQHDITVEDPRDEPEARSLSATDDQQVRVQRGPIASLGTRSARGARYDLSSGASAS